METENSVWYFRGKEARGRGEWRDACRAKGLHRVAWMRGWDAEDALQGRAIPRTPEQEREHAEAVEWLNKELEAWLPDRHKTARHKTQEALAQAPKHESAPVVQPELF